MSQEKTAARDFWCAVLDTAMEGFIAVDHQGRIRHLNPAAAELLDLNPATAVGRHFRTVFCPSLPEEKCWVNLALGEATSVRNHRFAMELSEGRRRALMANLTVFADGKHPFGALIAVRLADEHAGLHREREKQAAILGSLAEGLFTVDNEWRVTSFNRAAEQMTGWREEEVLGKYCKDVFGARQCVEGCPLAETLRRSSPILDFETVYRNRFGEDLPVLVNTAILYDSSGEAVGGVVSFRSCKQNIFADGKSGCSFYGIVGKSRRMLDVFQIMREVADSKATVLILGESGTGKELVANAIQKLSSRRHGPYVKVNCAAIPDTLLESELFGHVKGAFTDAHADRIGRFALADSGTIFLDEVGDLTPPAQLRLLRVLEEGEFQRLGSSETMRVDVRVIAATNRNLWQLVHEGRFRDDLFYRLNVIPITLPPLAQRREDLPLLIEHFMEKYRRLTGKPVHDISDKAYELLMAYTYPGNVRELENIIEHAFARTDSSVITENKLPFYLRWDSDACLTAEGAVADAVSEERSRILSVLQRHHWNRVRAARALGWSRTTLWRRMRELDLLEKPEHKGASTQ